MNRFERGGDIKRNLSVGLNSTSPDNYPEEGRHFFVRFRLRRSCPEYYPLQAKEKKEIPIIAISEGPERWKINNDSSVVVCKIPECMDKEDFFATWNEQEKFWEIS